MGCFDELRNLEFDVALDSFWPPVGEPAPPCLFGILFTDPALITKLHLGTKLFDQK